MSLTVYETCDCRDVFAKVDGIRTMLVHES